MRARLADVRQVAEGTAAFSFALEEPLSFAAGQTLDLTLPAPKYVDARGNAHTFSIASSPGEPSRVMIATRLTGSAFKRSLMDMAVGTDVEIDAPYGSFTLHQNAARPAVFFAGGIGITPFYSILQDATARALGHPITLVYANRTPESTAFLPDLRRLALRNSHLRIVATVTEPVHRGRWQGEVGLVDAGFIRRHVPDRQAATHYIAGPGAFVTAMRDALTASRVDPDHVRFEEFPGY